MGFFACAQALVGCTGKVRDTLYTAGMVLNPNITFGQQDDKEILSPDITPQPSPPSSADPSPRSATAAAAARSQWGGGKEPEPEPEPEPAGVAPRSDSVRATSTLACLTMHRATLCRPAMS